MAGTIAAPEETGLLRAMAQRPAVVAGLAILAILLLAAVLAPWLAPHNPGQLAIRNRLTAPSAAYWFGTDEYGRDTFSRVIYAGRVSLAVGLGVAGLSSLLGVALGLAGGFFAASTCRRRD